MKAVAQEEFVSNSIFRTVFHCTSLQSYIYILRKSHAFLVMGDPVFNAFDSCYWPSNSSYKARESPVPENTSVYQVQDVDELYKFGETVVQWLVL